MATPVGLLVLLMVFDFRLGILSMIPIVLGFIEMSAMTGKGMEVKMKEYQNALADMSNEAVEYVRGIPGCQDVWTDHLFLQTIQRRD